MTTSTASRAAGLLIALTTTAALAACSASDSGSDAASGGSAPAGAESGSDSGSPTGAGYATGGGTDGAASDRAGSADGPTTPQLERSVISNGTISLTGEDVRATRREVQRVVDARGGEVTDETSETDSDGDTAYVRLVVRVPSAEFGETMAALEQVGVLRTSDRGSDDVTTEVIDTGVRVRAQEASLRRVELLLAEARDLKDIIWIESQLTSRQAELDSLKSQQSWLADQTSLSTITVDISRHEVVDDEPDEEEPAGFLAGLDDGTRALGAVVTILTTVAGALLPFAAVALLFGLPIWLVVRRRRVTASGAPEVAADRT